MSVFVRAAIAVLLLGVGAGAANQQPSFRSSTDVVPVYATVVDVSGRLVRGLTSDDFEIYDNGERRAIEVFSGEPQPLTLVVMIDRSDSMRPYGNLVDDAVTSFVGFLDVRDRARVGSFGSTIALAPASFTNDLAALARIIESGLPSGGPTPLWNATAAALGALDGELGRRVVLLFTDGDDDPESAVPFDAYVSWPTIRSRVERGDTMVYGVGLASLCGGPGTLRRPRRAFQTGAPRFPIPTPRRPATQLPPRQPPRFPAPPGPSGRTLPREEEEPACIDDRPSPYLRELAEAGGGGYFELSSANELRETFARIAEELHQQYLIGFRPELMDGSTRRLEVRVVPKEGRVVSVRTRTSYVAGRVSGEVERAPQAAPVR